MGECILLKSVFSSQKENLATQLAELSLPNDAHKVQKVVADFLNVLFENEGTYRQSLTQSEDYILQAAMSLLNAQQSIAAEISSRKIEPKIIDSQDVEDDSTQAKLSGLKKEQYPYAIGGTAIGGAAGAVVLGTWGAVFGAIAGTAIALYYSTQQIQSNKSVPVVAKPRVEVVSQKIDAIVFVNIVENICQSVDSLIGTFRAQINRVIDKYESIEKPTLEGDYVELLENIQSLLGAYAMDLSNENRSKRIEQRIQLLSESLDNYDLQVVNYNGLNKELFNFQPSVNVTTEMMVLPAIVKGEKVIIKGKVFVKQ